MLLPLLMNLGMFGTTTAEQPKGGGDSTRLRKRGRRPRYFWEAAFDAKQKDKIAEAVFDAVADAYLIESKGELFTQVDYLKRLERQLEANKYWDLAHQVAISLKTLSDRVETRKREDQKRKEIEEEAELMELLEIM